MLVLFIPLTPHFQMIKLMFTGVYSIFLSFALKLRDFGTRYNHLNETVLTVYSLIKVKKNILIFHLKTVKLTAVKIAVYCIHAC